MKTLVPLLVCCCLWLPSSHATDANNAFSIRGVGALPCETYLQEIARKSNIAFMIGGWLDGYVTATNRLTPDTYDALSFENTDLVANLVAAHCKRHPTDPLYAVLGALLVKLQDDRLRVSSPRVKGRVGDQEFSLYAEVLKRVQGRLAALGLYQGDPEPEFGEKTREALVAFQRNSNLQPTGLPDQPTLWRLLRRPDGSAALR
jgi:hypothetical protein